MFSHPSLYMAVELALAYWVFSGQIATFTTRKAALLMQASLDSLAFVFGFVLARFPLAQQARDGYLHADDRTAHLGDVLGGCILNLPSGVASGFMRVGEIIDQAVQPIGIVNETDTTVRMHDAVIPGRHDLAMLALGGIPRWCDVRLRSLKHRQHIGLVLDAFPECIGAGDMAAQSAMFATVGIQHEGQVIGVEPLRAQRDESGERVMPDQRM